MPRGHTPLQDVGGVMPKVLLHLAAACVLVVCVVPGVTVIGARGDSRRLHVGPGSVAAGHAHTVIATPDGRVWTWGNGTRGQLGDGTLVDRSSPGLVPNLDGVVAVTAGAAHTVALSSDGRVYAWGANAFGRIGDGTKKKRVRPVLVRGLTNVTMVAAGRAHTLALTVDGHVFAWGRNVEGQLGIGTTAPTLVPLLVRDLSDVIAIAAGDTHSLAVTSTGRVFAWGSNQFSKLGDGTTKDRVRPIALALRDVVSVAAGAAHSAALLRNGSVFSWGQGAYGALGIGSRRVASKPTLIPGLRATAIAAGRRFSAAIREDGRMVSWGANESGQLGDRTTTTRPRPVAVDGLSAVSAIALGDAHAIAVTTSGDVRTWGAGGSGQLGNGATLGRSTFVEIISDVLDWGSPVEDEEPPDTEPPTITVSTSPPLQPGWMTTPITVTFQCADNVGVTFCPEPVTIAGDAYAQRISGTASDAAGNHATAAVVVNIDLNPPELAITQPLDQSTTEADAVTITGHAVDRASGLADTKCNGAPAAIVDDLVQCIVALQPGRNDIILHAIDVAGHNASSAIAITRTGPMTTLSLTPAARAMVITERAILSLRDEYGAVVDQAAWSTSDEGIVTLSDEDPPVLTATGIGPVTITAEKNGVSVTASIDVSAALVAGVTRWTLPPLAGLSSEQLLFANRVDAAGPDFFTVETVDWGKATLRAVGADGEVLWQQHSPGIPLMGDSFGGVLSGVVNDDGGFVAYVRLGGGSVRPWRYESAGFVDKPAQAPDGTLFGIEHLPGGRNIDGDAVQDKYLLVLNGATGSVISRTRLRREVDEFLSDSDGVVINAVPPIHCRTLHYDWAPDTTGPVVGSDGRGYLLVRRHEVRSRGECIPPFLRRPDRIITMGIDLVMLSPTAEPVTVTIYSASCEAGLGTTLPCDLPVRAFQVLPDGVGGTLVTWERGTHMVGNDVFVQRSMTRVDADGTIVERNVPPQFSVEMIGQAGAALTYDDGWRRVDVRSGETLWSGALPDFTPLAVRPDGGLASFDNASGELTLTGPDGVVESSHPFNLDWRAVNHAGNWIGLRNASLTAVVGEYQDATRWSALRGNAQNQMAVRQPGKGIWAKTHLAFPSPFDLIRYRHVSIRVVPADPQKWLERGIELRGTDAFGNGYFTIGAGSDTTDTNSRCAGTLVADLNRLADYVTPPWDPLELLPYSRAAEDNLIQELLGKTAAYKDDLPYACRPEQNPGYFNSNSFAHGLLNAVRLGLPRMPERMPTLVPGWLTPVPRSKFQ